MSAETWTVMVYLAGDNNLTDNCVYSLAQMKEVGSDGQLSIFAQFDPQDDYLETHRYKIRKRGNSPVKSAAAGSSAVTASNQSPDLNADIIDTSGPGGFKSESRVYRQVARNLELNAGETDTGSPITLQNFITFCAQSVPANRYMLVLSGHSAGIQKDYLLKDDTPGGYLTIPEFKEVFKFLESNRQNIPKNITDNSTEPLIDILGLDSCLMSMAEICYELKGLVSILIGSESYSPAAGWPYREILTTLRQDSTNGANSEAIASAIVQEYSKSYIDYSLGGLSIDLSAIRVSKVDQLKDQVKILAQVLTEELGEAGFIDALVLSHWEAQSYNGELFIDLSDFCDCLKRKYPKENVVKVCEEVQNFIRRDLVIDSCFSGPVYQYSNGISIYFPWSKVEPYYRNLSFAQDSGWADFLEIYVRSTRRQPRQMDLPDNKYKQLLIDNFLPSKPNRMSSGKGPTNYVSSMRNPPITSFSSGCTRPVTGLLEGAGKLLNIMRATRDHTDQLESE